MGDLRGRSHNDPQRLALPELLRQLLSGARPTPLAETPTSDDREVLAGELARRLQRLAKSAGLNELTAEERQLVLAEVNSELLTQTKVDQLQALSQPEGHVRRMLGMKGAREVARRPRRLAAAGSQVTALPDKAQIELVRDLLEQIPDQDRLLLKLALERTFTVAAVAALGLKFSTAASRLIRLLTLLAGTSRKQPPNAH